MYTPAVRWGVAAVAVALAVSAGGCSWFRKAPAPIDAEEGATQIGVASWYGPGFHGRRTANGEIYDQYGLTAAHRTLPHNTRVNVTNLATGQEVEVRINDRGPYVDDRIIDLSYTAAQRIGMIGSGIAPVEVEVLEPGPAKMVYVTNPAPLPARSAAAPAPRPEMAQAAPRVEAVSRVETAPSPARAVSRAEPAGGVTAQYRVHAGVYADYQRARREQRRLDGVAGRVHLAQVDAAEARYYQLRVGPFASRDAAAQAARRLAELGVPALVVTAGATR